MSDDVVFDKAEQVEKVKAVLLDGEALIAVLDGKGGGTGFLGLTDRRIVLQDNSFVGKKIALTSVPYSRVHAVSFVTDKSMFGRSMSSGTLSISIGAKEYEIEFRGEDKAKLAHDVIFARIA